MDVISSLSLIGVITPLAIMMMVFVNGRDAFPSTMLLFWRLVLFIAGDKMPESKQEKADRLVEGTRVFAENAKSISELITADPNALRVKRQKRWAEHADWTRKMYPPQPIEDDGEFEVEDEEDTFTIRSWQGRCKYHTPYEVCHRCDK